MRTHEHKGRLWLEIGSRPHTRKDGTTTELTVWVTRCCADGCTEVVEVATPANSDLRKTQSFGAKHCPAHKLTKEQVNERWLAGIRAKRT